MTRALDVIGAGGHAKVVIATARAAGWRVASVLDDDEARWGAELLGVEVRGPIAAALESGADGAIIAIGANRARERFATSLQLPWARVVHPSAIVHESATIGLGTVVFAGCVVQPETRIGAHVIVNTGATIDHDCVIEDYAHIAPGVHLCGNVTVEQGALLGVSSCAIPGARVGSWSTVGAGAVVAHAVPADTVAIGAPAKPRNR